MALDPELDLSHAAPKRFVPARSEFAFQTVATGLLALVQCAVLLWILAEEGVLRNWGWAVGSAIYVAVLRITLVYRPMFATAPVADATHASQPAEPRRVGLITALVAVAIMTIAIAALVRPEVAGGTVALMVSFSGVEAAIGAMTLHRIRSLERSYAAPLLLMDSRRLRIDGRKPTWTERRALERTLFTDGPPATEGPPG